MSDRLLLLEFGIDGFGAMQQLRREFLAGQEDYEMTDEQMIWVAALLRASFAVGATEALKDPDSIREFGKAHGYRMPE